jgi:replicative DNA helicase
MGLRVARIKRPQVEVAALNDFFTALHDLHLKAGHPSTRDIQKDVGRNVVSHTTIHKALSGPRLPGWGIVELMVEALASRSRQDPETITETFRALWEAASKSTYDEQGIDSSKARLAVQSIRANSDNRSASAFSELMPGTLDVIEAAGARNIALGLVPTGFSDIDALTGGLRPGQLVAIGSRPSAGKSTLLITICAHSAIKYDVLTAIFSTESTEREIQMRILSAESRVPYHALRAGFMNDSDWARLARRMSEVADAPLRLSHSPRLSITDFSSQARGLAGEGRPALLAIDNIDALIAASGAPTDTLYDLKQIAAELKIPILVTANMRDSPDASEDRPLGVSNLWYAEAIEAIADIVTIVHRPDSYNLESPRAGEVDLIFAKNRNGPTATITVAFQAHYSRMVDMFISDNPGPGWSFIAAGEADT